MPPRRPLRLLAACPLAALAASAPAQIIDYDALRQTMGEPVTISATGKPQRQSETSASTTIITREEILRSPARDVPGLLKTYAGIDVNRWTAGQSDVAVRGGVQTYNARLLVLVDGRQVYLDHYGLTDWNLIGVQLEEIQQIELVRGPTSALFGFNAASGVVSIITRKGQGAAAATVSASGGNHGSSQVAGTLAVPLADTIDARLTAGRMREDERDIPAELLRPTSVRGVAGDQVSARLNGSFGATAATIGGGYSTNRQAEYLPSQILSNQRYRNGNVSATLGRDTDWGGVSINGYANWLDVRYAVEGTGGGRPSSIEVRNRIAALKPSALYRLGDGRTVRLGLEYRHNRLRGNAQFADTIAYDVLAGEAMLDIPLGDDVRLTSAARLDRLWLRAGGRVVQPAFDDPSRFDRRFDRLSLNAALLVRNGDRGRLRINGGLGYQLPSLENYGVRVQAATPSPVPLFVAGAPRIRPVRIWSAEAGYTHDLDVVRIEATGFFNRTEGVIASPGDGVHGRAELFLVPTPVVVARFASAGDYETYGAEIGAGGTLSSLTWRANYTWTHTAGDPASTALPFQFAIAPRETTPVHKANLTLGYDATRWYVSGVARYVSATRQLAFTPAPQLLLFRVKAALAFDGRVGLRLADGLEVFAAGENLSLASGAAGSPIPADRRVRAGVRVDL